MMKTSLRTPHAAAVIFRLAIALLFALTLTGAGKTQKEIYTTHDKAYYADATIVQFVRPGLNLVINSAKVAADGTMTAVLTITDPQGLPLDVTGVTTPGVISLSLTLGYIPQTSSQYVSYVTSSSTGAAGTFVRPSSENAITTTTGKLTSLGGGQYQYVFGAKAKAGFDQTATHTVAAWSKRDLTQFSLPANFASATFNFRPDGGAVTKIRDVVSTAACDNCHDQLSFHGGSRRGVAVCVMCHTPAMIDSNTGQSVDFKVFIHKIHAGSVLPSVIAGGDYTIGSSSWKTVVYPADVRRCETCHDPKTATQANLYNSNPTAEACGSCHDDVNFMSGVNHAGGPQINNAMCSNCHIPQGDLEFDASIKGAHTIPVDSSYLTGLVVTLNKVTNNLAGQKPTVSFNLKDKNGNGIAFPTGGTLTLNMAGPTNDYGYTSFGADVTTTPGYVTESVTAAACDGSGNCSYTFNHAVPAAAKGTYAIGVEARRSETILAGTTSQQTVQYGAKNQVMYFSVDGSAVAPRRQVVSIDSCNKCHVELSLHGTLRNQTEYCVLCHNPSNSDFTVRPSATDPTERTKPNQGINFNLLVHRIHTGVNQPPDRPYTVIGFGGSVNNFSDVRFPPMDPTGNPHDTRNCEMCHVNASETNLPAGKNQVTDPQGPINPIQAISSACTGCHMAQYTAAHALSNTSSIGEACQACHNPSNDYSVSSVHAQY
jgi:OmcA/MtrC family decaheme c-type cytochrome